MSAVLTEQAARSRRRADRLRALAVDLERSPMLRLDLVAGVDTWRGPTADASVADLRRLQHRVHVEIERIRSAAWWFERHADELERQAQLVVLVS